MSHLQTVLEDLTAKFAGVLAKLTGRRIKKKGPPLTDEETLTAADTMFRAGHAYLAFEARGSGFIKIGAG